MRGAAPVETVSGHTLIVCAIVCFVECLNTLDNVWVDRQVIHSLPEITLCVRGDNASPVPVYHVQANKVTDYLESSQWFVREEVVVDEAAVCVWP